MAERDLLPLDPRKIEGRRRVFLKDTIIERWGCPLDSAVSGLPNRGREKVLSRTKSFLIYQLEKCLTPSLAYVIAVKREEKPNYYQALFDLKPDAIWDLIEELVGIESQAREYIVNLWRGMESVLTDIARFLDLAIGIHWDGRALALHDIIWSAGDIHDNYKSTVILDFGESRKLVYSPISGSNGAQRARLLIAEEISALLGWEALKSVEVITINNLDFRIFVPYDQQVADREEASHFYHNCGTLLGVSTLFNIGDLHFENIVASGLYPVAIDVETLFHQPHKDSSDEINDVLGTLLLELCNYESTNIYAGLLGGGLEGFKAYTSPLVVNDGTDDFRVVYRSFGPYNQDNRKYLNGEILDPCEYSEEIVKGFQEVLEAVIKEKSRLRRFLENLSRTVHFKSRYIIRPTAQYALLISKSYSPLAVLDEGFWGSVESRLYEKSDFPKKIRDFIVRKEMASLKKGVIPYFYRDSSCSDRLYSLDGEFVGSVFTPYEKYFYDKVAALDSNYIEMGIGTIRECLESLRRLDFEKFNAGWSSHVQVSPL